MKRILAILLISLFPVAALAVSSAPEIVSRSIATGITAADLSTGPTTITLDVRSFSLIKLQVRLVRGGLATDVNIKCEESDDGTTWSKVTTTDAAGVTTELSLTFATTVTVNFTVRPDVTGFINFRCTFTGAGATSSDLITVLASDVRGL
jgi:hypothetical protein